MIVKGAKKVTSASNLCEKPLSNQQKFDRLNKKNDNLGYLVSTLGLDSDLSI